MKHLKSILALVLVVALCMTLLVACAKSEKNEAPKDDPKPVAPPSEPANNDKEETPSTPETPDEPAQSEQPSAPQTPAEPDEEEEEDIAEIEFYLWTLSDIDSDIATGIADEMSKITEPAIGVHVNLHAISSGSYGQQITMALSGGETVDVCCVLVVPPYDFPTMYSAGQLMNIEDLLNQYGQDLLAEVGDFINAYKLDGGTWGIPVYRNYAGIQWLIMRTDILDELGLVEQAENATSFSEVESIFAQVKANTDVWPFGSGIWMPTAGTGWYSDDFTVWDAFDGLGDGLGVIHADASGVVSNAWESDGFTFVCKKAKEWFDAGYTWPDSLLEGEHIDTVMKQGILFSDIQPGEMDTAIQKASSTGYDITVCKMSASMIDTGSVTKFGCGVPVTSQEPEAAIKFLNMLYTDSRLMNLLDWGLEGRDYILLDSGEATYINGDANVPYHVQDFIFGNFFLVAPWEGSGANFRQESMDVMNSTPVSPFLGCSFNAAGLGDQIAAITACREEYLLPLTRGTYSEEMHQDFLTKLQAAGIDEYLAAAQAQLDAFLANR